MKKPIVLTAPYPTTEELDQRYPVSAERKIELEELAKFLFDNQEKILSMDKRDARDWVTQNAITKDH